MFNPGKVAPRKRIFAREVRRMVCYFPETKAYQG
jgi:hypothetical protein